MRSSWAAAVLAVLTVGCGIVSPDFERIIALEIETRALTLQVGNSDTLVARALNAAGDVVDDASISWAIVDVDSGQIGFTLDTTNGVLQAQQVGAGRVQARVEDLRSEPILITIVEDTSATPLSHVAPIQASPFTGLPRRREGSPRHQGLTNKTHGERAATLRPMNAAYRRPRPVSV